MCIRDRSMRAQIDESEVFSEKSLRFLLVDKSSRCVLKNVLHVAERNRPVFREAPEGVVRVSSASMVDLQDPTFVHVWVNAHEAQRYQLAFETLTNCVVQHGAPTGVVSVPLSSSMRFQGKYVTCTWLPPLARTQPLTDIPDGSLLDGVLRMVKASTHGCETSGRSDVLVFEGLDGRYYLVPGAPEDVLPPAGVNVTHVSDTHTHQRAERRINIDAQFPGADEATIMNERLVQCGRRLAQSIKAIPKDEPAPDELISTVMHYCGLSVRDMYRLYDTKPWPADTTEEMSQRIQQSIMTNMVGRALKSVMEAAVEMHPITGQNDAEKSLSRVSISAAFLHEFMKSSKMLTGPIAAHTRQKFNIPDSVKISRSSVSLGNLISLVCKKLGLYFHVASRQVLTFSTPTINSVTASPASSLFFFATNSSERVSEVATILALSKKAKKPAHRVVLLAQAASCLLSIQATGSKVSSSDEFNKQLHQLAKIGSSLTKFKVESFLYRAATHSLFSTVKRRTAQIECAKEELMFQGLRRVAVPVDRTLLMDGLSRTLASVISIRESSLADTQQATSHAPVNMNPLIKTQNDADLIKELESVGGKASEIAHTLTKMLGEVHDNSEANTTTLPLIHEQAVLDVIGFCRLQARTSDPVVVVEKEYYKRVRAVVEDATQYTEAERTILRKKLLLDTVLTTYHMSFDNDLGREPCGRLVPAMDDMWRAFCDVQGASSAPSFALLTSMSFVLARGTVTNSEIVTLDAAAASVQPTLFRVACEGEPQEQFDTTATAEALSAALEASYYHGSEESKPTTELLLSAAIDYYRERAPQHVPLFEAIRKGKTTVKTVSTAPDADLLANQSTTVPTPTNTDVTPDVIVDGSMVDENPATTVLSPTVTGGKPPLPPSRGVTPGSASSPFRTVFKSRRLSSSGNDGPYSAGFPNPCSGSQDEDIFARPATVNVVESDLGALFNDIPPELLRGDKSRTKDTDSQLQSADLDRFDDEMSVDDDDKWPADQDASVVDGEPRPQSSGVYEYGSKNRTRTCGQQTSTSEFPVVEAAASTSPVASPTRTLNGRPLTAPVSEDPKANHAALIANLEAERLQVAYDREQRRLRIIADALQSSAQDADSQASSAPKMSCAFDILYRSSQQCHSFTAPIAIVCFLDLENAHTAYLASPERQRKLDVAREKANSPTVTPIRNGRGPPRNHEQLVMRKKLGHMQNKLDQLEAEARISAISDLVDTEGRRRAVVVSDFGASMAKLHELLDTSACVAEAKFANRRRLETLLGKPLIRGQYLPDEEDDDDIGLDDEALMEINMQRARDRRAKASAAAPVSTIGTRSRDAESLLKKRGHNNEASEYLRALKEELDELEPENKPKEVSALAKSVGILPPLNRPHTTDEPRTKVESTARSGSAQSTRTLAPGANLPYLQRHKLSEHNRLAPLVAFAAPDGDLKGVPKRLPPPTSSTQLRTPQGRALPSVLYAAVDIAASKQRNDDEQVRLQYETNPKLVRLGTRPSSATLLPPIAAPKRSNEAIAILSQQAHDGMKKWARSTVLQTFARAWLSDLRRIEMAQIRIKSWMLLTRDAFRRRKRMIRISDFRQSNLLVTRKKAFAAFVQWYHNRIEGRKICRDLVLDNIVFSKKLSKEIKASDLLTMRNIPIRIFNIMSPWLQWAHQQRSARNLQLMVVRTESTYFQEAWYRFTNGVANKNVFNKYKDHKLVKNTRVYALMLKNRRRLLKDRLASWINSLVRHKRAEERVYQFKIAHREIIRARHQRGVDKVWIETMFKTGWARKYLKIAYEAMYQHRLERKKNSY
eukprot:TRINITY_DN2333_c0_g1_i1.p1 TRINITY_DN2333_c0_g1~~TRINITY_DN2333_c0_g1_i1.p1  ORF type:complete len:1800 (+),score=336.48 TRINITY_DN2333_c0_g1_i1:163-5562(+)